jgi:O-antigen/teichoic acid export membrane protein
VAKPFFIAWAGPEFGVGSTVPFYVLLVGLSFNILAYVPHSVIVGLGRTDILAKVYWIELVVYAVLVWYLTSVFGIVGAAVAWSCRTVVDAIIQFTIAKKVFKIGVAVGQLREFRRSLLFPLSLLLVLPAFFLGYSIQFALALIPLVLLTYLVVGWLFLTTAEERGSLSAFIQNRLALLRGL